MIKKEKKEKKKKDKDAPKRPMSAFFCYQKSRRDNLKKESPKLSNTELISKMAEEWKKLGDAAKAPYVKMAKEEKEKYDKAKAAYDAKKKKPEKKSPDKK